VIHDFTVSDVMQQSKFVPVTVVAARYSVGPATVWRWARSGRIPKPIEISPGCTRWSLEQLDESDAKRIEAAASQATAAN